MAALIAANDKPAFVLNSIAPDHTQLVFRNPSGCCDDVFVIVQNFPWGNNWKIILVEIVDEKLHGWVGRADLGILEHDLLWILMSQGIAWIPVVGVEKFLDLRVIELHECHPTAARREIHGLI